ncbi:hypothetical protein [Streptomyces sp. RFCAC02]|nr:hypothetical protein [Streptomyces sp. RFCAC02]
MKKFVLSLAAAFLIVGASSGIAAADTVDSAADTLAPASSVWA